ncbi:unnamed protein product [Lampetra fluviatilis]
MELPLAPCPSRPPSSHRISAPPPGRGRASRGAGVSSRAEGISEQARAGFGTGAGAVARHHGDTGAAPGGRALEWGRRGLPPVPCPSPARPVRF